MSVLVSQIASHRIKGYLFPLGTNFPEWSTLGFNLVSNLVRFRNSRALVLLKNLAWVTFRTKFRWVGRFPKFLQHPTKTKVRSHVMLRMVICYLLHICFEIHWSRDFHSVNTWSCKNSARIPRAVPPSLPHTIPHARDLLRRPKPVEQRPYTTFTLEHS